MIETISYFSTISWNKVLEPGYSEFHYLQWASFWQKVKQSQNIQFISESLKKEIEGDPAADVGCKILSCTPSNWYLFISINKDDWVTVKS